MCCFSPNMFKLGLFFFLLSSSTSHCSIPGPSISLLALAAPSHPTPPLHPAPHPNPPSRPPGAQNHPFPLLPPAKARKEPPLSGRGSAYRGSPRGSGAANGGGGASTPSSLRRCRGGRRPPGRRRPSTCQAGGGVHPLEELPGAQLPAVVGVSREDGLAHADIAARRRHTPLHGAAGKAGSSSGG